jgi:hypothetical protein
MSTRQATRTMLATKAIGRIEASMRALCNQPRRRMMNMNRAPMAARPNMEFRPEQASATSSWYGPIEMVTPDRAIGSPARCSASTTITEIQCFRGPVTVFTKDAGSGIRNAM